ncbi:hypothetical protein Val02_83870 [Virgisporangium aliadipatigenens]|uniref:O-antigen ligase-related domain-containing protein n=1 Tax=Virgisporangium aliadipatigenens TaxID=741659 RepID=A0A8J3YXF5_9ACTN|nr:O-antigen ligase family protein [Virgisporangium aliadipatigenens]GIJ51501.1 hypothetical protein Val02_83870 [Virgisporangium aliadipatigenens]
MKTNLAAGAIIAAVAVSAVEFYRTGNVLESLEALVAGIVAAGIAALAFSLRGITWRGLVTGGFFVGAGVLSWTFSETKLIVWGFLAAEGIVFMVLAWPWLRDLRTLPRIGGVWLGIGYWIIGVAGALLMLKVGIAAQRVAYLGVFALAVLAVLASTRRDRDLTVGIVAAFLYAIAALTMAGSGEMFDDLHAVPSTGWGENMEHRFWGGEWLLYHPNSLGMLALVVVVRIGPSGAFSKVQRVGAVAIGAWFIYLTNSRTAFIFAAAAAVVYAVLLWWRTRRPVVDLAVERRPWLAAATPFIALLLIFAVSGGTGGFLMQERHDGGGVTSGRLDTWKQVFTDWRDGPVVEKAFGSTRDSRATVYRESSGEDVKLTTDNAAVGALRRGGVLGVAAFLVGLYLLLRHAGVWRMLREAPAVLRRREVSTPTAPAWLAILAISMLPTIMTSDWLLGGTGGTLWILLLAAEAAVLLAATAAPDDTPAEPAPSFP